MKITLVPSTVSGVVGDPLQFGTSYVVNESLAIDAGTLGFYRGPAEQSKIKHVLISHSHADHIASLPIFVENVFEAKSDCVRIYGNSDVIECLRSDVFNDRVWPDFEKLSEGPMKQTPLVKFIEIEAGQTLHFDGVEVRTVAVDHLVPTLGFILKEGDTHVVIPSDTGPTQRIWDLVNELPGVSAVFLEVCFPDHMSALADSSRHLVPATFKQEVLKVNSQGVKCPFYAVHIKARYRDQVLQELEAHEIPGLRIARFGVPYVF
ncbi:MBL fold metallo-hydrolase [Tautonia sociabilis]|uniref:MBL fold metallo-hydrolase n=1 Tax=Tautonia sociabilis TaxID=2080755 RepID=A0A432MMM8_9BACT|nr:MBL fold metallo-hydrolase [Tautonia sociabilis]RUL88355.1 MBL fold metallo-hydrolase [Tautonia sociabilis]